MKKLFLSLALVFGMVATAAAQVNVGGRLAGTMSTFKGDDTEEVIEEDALAKLKKSFGRLK